MSADRQIRIHYEDGPLDGRVDDAQHHLASTFVMEWPNRRGQYRLVRTEATYTLAWRETKEIPVDA